MINIFRKTQELSKSSGTSDTKDSKETQVKPSSNRHVTLKFSFWKFLFHSWHSVVMSELALLFNCYYLLFGTGHVLFLFRTSIEQQVDKEEHLDKADI